MLKQSDGRLKNVLYDKDLFELIEYEGIGRVKAIQLKAVGEIAKRVNQKENVETLSLNSSKEVSKIYIPKMKFLKEENMFVLYLNVKNKLIKEEKIKSTQPDQINFEVLDITRGAVKNLASSVILVHNHPSGDATPSFEDIEATKEVSKQLRSVGVRLLDHVIVAGDDYISIINNM